MFNLRNKSSNPTCDGHFFFFYFRGRKKKVPCGICKKEFRSDKLKTHREVCKKKIPVAKPPKGQRKKETCKFCKKKFERIKKHVCLSKRKYKPSKNDVDDIKKYFKNKKKNPFIESEADISIETITISDDDDASVHESDDNFIDDDTEIVDDPSVYQRKDNDEFRERLRDLGHTIETDDPVRCKWCNEDVFNITEHEKNCTHKKFPCFRCGVMFTPAS